MAEAPNFLHRDKLPTPVILTVVAICIAPFILNLFGIDFGSEERPFDPAASVGLAPQQLIDSLFESLSGSFTHTILEWSAFCSAIFTVILSFCLFYVNRNVSIPIIGMALFCAGCMDAFHTLVADRLIEATADHQNLIPFTWAVSRVFNAIILIIGAGLLLSNQTRKFKGSLSFVLGMSLLFGFLAYALITYCATSNQLPETLFPQSLVTRPWDVAPLVLYIIGFIFIFPKYYQQDRSFFSHAIVISCIPNISTQLYMAFGSSALFDNAFNVAHFLKILSYLVPFVGLALEFVKSLYQEAQALGELKKEKNKILEERSKEFNAIFQSVADPLITIDDQGMIESFNPAAERTFGYSTSEAIGKNVKMLMPEPYHSEHDGYIRNYRETGQAKIIGIGREVVGKRRDGSIFPLDLAVNKIKVGDRTMYVGTCRDISERKKAVQELADSRSTLEKQYWLKTGFSELHNTMRGDQDEAALSQNIINYLADRLNMQVGAVYLSENGEMRFAAGYAYHQGMKLSDHYQKGGGLVSQAALEKKSILVRDLPDDYIRVQSGLVDVPLRNLLVTPIVFEEEVIGVLELASLDEIQQDHREFLNQAVEAIAINLNSSRARARLAELLESKK